MRIYTTNDESKLLAVWLTGEERADLGIMSAIEPVMSAYGRMGYRTAVYSPGTGDLAADTAALLKAANRAEMRSGN